MRFQSSARYLRPLGKNQQRFRALCCFVRIGRIVQIRKERARERSTGLRIGSADVRAFAAQAANYFDGGRKTDVIGILP